MSMKTLHKEFIEQSKRPMELGRPVISPKAPDVPVLAMDRWTIVNDVLRKKYKFRRPEDRPRFVMTMFDYEAKVQHHAILIVDEDEVEIRLKTKTINRVTELDKEYAKFADEVFRDLVYNPMHVE